MATMKQEESMREIAGIISALLNEAYGQPMGWFLNVAPFHDGKNGVADYISNSQRETAIEWMKETIVRFENNETIPASEGES